jgi:hypothetical protein
LQGPKFARTSSGFWILLIPRFWVLGFVAHIKVSGEVWGVGAHIKVLLLLLEFVIATGL